MTTVITDATNILCISRDGENRCFTSQATSGIKQIHRQDITAIAPICYCLRNVIGFKIQRVFGGKLAALELVTADLHIDRLYLNILSNSYQWDKGKIRLIHI